MITITKNKGFQLQFENLTISVQIGSMNYCSRKSHLSEYGSEIKQELVQSEDAEIAIWDKDNNWFDFGHDQVLGYVPTNEVGAWIARVAKAQDLSQLSQLSKDI